MQPEPFPNHKITEIWRGSKSRSPFFRSLLDGFVQTCKLYLVVASGQDRFWDEEQ